MSLKTAQFKCMSTAGPLQSTVILITSLGVRYLGLYESKCLALLYSALSALCVTDRPIYSLPRTKPAHMKFASQPYCHTYCPIQQYAYNGPL